MKILKILSSMMFCAAGLAALGARAKADSIPVADPYFNQFPAGPTLFNGVLVGPGTPNPYLYFSCGGRLQVCRRQRRRLDFLGDLRPSSRSLRSGANRPFEPTFNGPPIIAGTTTPEPIVVRDINATISQVVSTTALAGVTYTLDVDLGFGLDQAPRRCLRLSHGREHNVEVSNATGVLWPVADSDAGQRQLVRFRDFLHRDQRGRWRSDHDRAFIHYRQHHANRIFRRCAADGLIDGRFGSTGRAGARDLGDDADRLRRNGWRCCCSPLIATAKRSRPARLTAKKRMLALGDCAPKAGSPPAARLAPPPRPVPARRVCRAGRRCETSPYGPKSRGAARSPCSTPPRR